MAGKSNISATKGKSVTCPTMISQVVFGMLLSLHRRHGKASMDSRILVSCVMSMSLVQTQAKLSVPEIFQQLGVELSCPFSADSVFRAQRLGCYHCKIKSRLMLDVFQCQSCRHFILPVLGTLFYSIKLSLNFGLLLSQAMASPFSLVQKRLLSQLSQSMVFGIQIHAYHG